MNKLRTLVVDDEKNGRIVAVELLKMILGDEVEVYEANSVSQALDKLKDYDIELIFLDINMPRATGFDLLDQIENDKYKVIFLTAHENYALKAFKYSALHYLLKPLTEEKLMEAINRLPSQEPLNEESKDSIVQVLRNPSKISVFSEDKVLELFDLEDLIYLQADGSGSILFFNKADRKTSTKKLGHYEEILENSNFVRIHHSYLLNLNYVESFNSAELEIKLLNGKVLNVSVRKRGALNVALKKLSFR